MHAKSQYLSVSAMDWDPLCDDGKAAKGTRAEATYPNAKSSFIMGQRSGHDPFTRDK